MPNMGSAMAPLGPSPDAQQALKAAIEARQTGGQPVPQLNQTTPAAPMPPSPQPGAAPTNAVGGSPQAAKPPSSEAEIILKAMDARLKTISTVDKANLIKPQPTTGTTQ